MIPKDSIDYYPTPRDLAKEMVRCAFERRAETDQPILEPSAGDGELVKAIYEFHHVHPDFTGKISKFCKGRIDVDCVEISSDLRAVLKNNGYRVVHDDFMTFSPAKRYKTIVMNPPFSVGASHLLRAIDIMSNGGKIVCLLNAETIRNPYTNERKELAEKLKKYDASIKYMHNAFSSAERRSDVEVALVVITIPYSEPVSKIRLDLKREHDAKMRENPAMYAMVSSDPITAAIERYNAAVMAVRRIYDEYEGIKPIISGANYDFDKGSKTANDPIILLDVGYNEAVKKLRMLYWKTLFSTPSITKNMPENMLREYRERIDELSDYDFSQYNILTIREEISKNIISSIDKEITKLFDMWTNMHYNEDYSKNIHYYNGWCTNEAYKVGKRVVFPASRVVYSFCGQRSFSEYGMYDVLHDIDVVMHYFDRSGCNAEEWDRDSVNNQIKNFVNGAIKHIKCRYFNAKFYKKGTCHIEFTNCDVLKSFNAYAGRRKGWLPPSYGSKYYDGMTAEEKHIIDSYEGSDSYDDSVARGIIITDSKFLALCT